VQKPAATKAGLPTHTHSYAQDAVHIDNALLALVGIWAAIADSIKSRAPRQLSLLFSIVAT